MKKTISILTMLAVASALASCSAKNTEPTVAQTTADTSVLSESVTAAETTTAAEETTAETTKETTAETENTADDDISDITGVWYEQDVLDARTLTVKEDGTFSLEYRGGGTMYGYVKIDNTAEDVFYDFYEEDDKLWTSFAKSGTGIQNELINGSGEGEHFIRDSVINSPDFVSEEPNQYGYYRITSAPAAGVSIAALEGTWYDADNDEYIVFHDCGLYSGGFDITYADKTIDEGKVYLEYSLNPDDTKEYWYNLYTYDDTFLIGFGVSGEIPFNDIYAGQSGEPHYTRIADDTAGDSAANDFIGVWACGRITADITEEEGEYLVTIHWSSTASEGSVWEYRCRYDNAEGVLRCEGAGTRTDYICDEDGNMTNTVVYSDSSASFEIKDNTLYWNDDREESDDGLELIR